MEKVIGTCGHQLYWKNDGAGFGSLFFIEEHSDEGKRVTSVCVCDKCAKWYRRKVVPSRIKRKRWHG